ncbi:hypothetical protein C8J57DRAFT_1235462 [Mycena rebaudengoi]|nr:hypothetical protein C8J57DRAFT_1235462 [Mycena rebaudengoi]
MWMSREIRRCECWSVTRGYDTASVDVRCAMEEEGIKRVEEQKRGRARRHRCRRGSSPITTRGASNTSRGAHPKRRTACGWGARRGGYNGGRGGAACDVQEEGKETGRKKIRQRKEEKERAGRSVSIHESSSLTPYKVGVGTATKLAQDERPRRAAGAPTGRFTSGTAPPSSF